MDLIWQVAQPLPFNIGAPGRLSDIISGINGVVYIILCDDILRAVQANHERNAIIESFYLNGWANSLQVYVLEEFSIECIYIINQAINLFCLNI